MNIQLLVRYTRNLILNEHINSIDAISFQLAQVLQVETELIKQAVSLYCRLHFARKLEPETEQCKAKRHPSWNTLPTQAVR